MNEHMPAEGDAEPDSKTIKVEVKITASGTVGRGTAEEKPS